MHLTQPKRLSEALAKVWLTEYSEVGSAKMTAIKPIWARLRARCGSPHESCRLSQVHSPMGPLYCKPSESSRAGRNSERGSVSRSMSACSSSFVSFNVAWTRGSAAAHRASLRTRCGSTAPYGHQAVEAHGAGIKITWPTLSRFQFTPSLASSICFWVTLIPCLRSAMRMPASVSFSRIV